MLPGRKRRSSDPRLTGGTREWDIYYDGTMIEDEFIKNGRLL